MTLKQFILENKHLYKKEKHEEFVSLQLTDEYSIKEKQVSSNDIIRVKCMKDFLNKYEKTKSSEFYNMLCDKNLKEYKKIAANYGKNLYNDLKTDGVQFVLIKLGKTVNAELNCEF